MKALISILAIAFFTSIAASLQLSSTHYIQHDFCWKDSYLRGLGTLPSQCSTGNQKIGLLCYEPCPAGYKRSGIDCHQICPNGLADQGLFCRNKQYGRGSGYAWKWSDGFSNQGMISRCESKEGAGKCQMWGAIAYPKCRDGFSNIGCCICRPKVPDCRALGMNLGIDLSCAKKIVIGKPHFSTCPSGTQYSLFFCHSACKAGYYGLGPVCWMNTPGKWVGCGMGAAKNLTTCLKTVIGEVAAVGQAAMKIAQELGILGQPGSAKPAAKQKTPEEIEQLKKNFENMTALYKASQKFKQILAEAKKVKETGEKIQDVYKKSVAAIDVEKEMSNLDMTKVTTADMARISAQIASLADPTGIAKVVESFSFPKCNEIVDQINRSSKV